MSTDLTDEIDRLRAENAKLCAVAELLHREIQFDGEAWQRDIERLKSAEQREREAYERAAKLCERHNAQSGIQLANMIRALKEQGNE